MRKNTDEKNFEYRVSLRIRSECEKIRTRKTPNTEIFPTCFAVYLWKDIGVFRTQSNIYARVFFNFLDVFII